MLRIRAATHIVRTNMYKQSNEDYRRLLTELCESLEVSSSAYDSGYFGEAKRIATSVRVLLHDTSRSHSLFKQIGIKEKLKYYSTPNPYGPSNILSECHLIRACIGQDIPYEPILDDFPPIFKWEKINFEHWWTEQIVKDVKGQTFSRKELVLSMAEQDGGAHVDPSLDKKYADLSRKNGLNWVFSKDGQIVEAKPGPEYACCRQIAFELLLSTSKNDKIIARALRH